MSELFYDELPAYEELERACFKEPWNAGQLLESYRTGYYVFTSVKEGERTVGYAAGAICGDQGELQRICVLPGSRRKGYARRLLDEIVRALRFAGCREIFLEVRRTNDAAIRLYESSGFALIGERKNYYGDDDALVYRLECSGTPEASGGDAELPY